MCKVNLAAYRQMWSRYFVQPKKNTVMNALNWMYISVIAYPLFFLLSLHYHSAIKYTLKKTIYIGKGIIYIHEFCNNAIHK